MATDLVGQLRDLGIQFNYGGVPFFKHYSLSCYCRVLCGYYLLLNETPNEYEKDEGNIP